MSDEDSEGRDVGECETGGRGPRGICGSELEVYEGGGSYEGERGKVSEIEGTGLGRPDFLQPLFITKSRLLLVQSGEVVELRFDTVEVDRPIEVALVGAGP